MVEPVSQRAELHILLEHGFRLLSCCRIRETVHAPVGCPLIHLPIPSCVAGKANIQLDASDGSMLGLDKRRALGYPGGAQRDFRFLGQ